MKSLARLLSIFLLVPLLLATHCSYGSPPAVEVREVPTPVACEKVATNGWLEQHGSMRVLYLQGTPVERGFAEGYHCANEIRALFDGFVLECAAVPIPALWDGVVRPRLLDGTHIPDRTLERLVGVLRGMQARDPRSLRIEKLDRDLTMEDLIAASALPDIVGLMCSSFTCWHAPADGGPARTLVGRNLDYIDTGPLADNVMVIVEAPSPESHGWISIGWPGVPGCVTGISDQGVFAAIHDVFLRERREGRVVPRLIALAGLMESVAAGPDAGGAGAALLRAQPLGMAGNCMLAWRGGAAVLEFDGREEHDGGVTLRAPAGDRNYVVTSNHFVERPGAERDCRRYRALSEQLAESERQPHTLDEAWRVIRMSSKSDTLYRLVADLATGELEIERRAGAALDWLPIVSLNAYELVTTAASGPAK